MERLKNQFTGFSLLLLLLGLLLLQETWALEAYGNNVQAITLYKRVKTCWGGCIGIVINEGYKSEPYTSYVCQAGWYSNNNIGCDYAICNGLTNLDGACRRWSVGGDCKSPDACSCPKHYYSTGPNCEECAAITNCVSVICTTSADQTCERCEGLGLGKPDQKGYRAYFASADRKTCNKACSWRSDSTRCYPGTCSTEFASSCSCSSGFSGPQCETITATPTFKNNELTFTSSDGTLVNAPADHIAGPSATQLVWTNLVTPATIRYKFEADFIPSVPKESDRHAYVNEAKIGVTGGTVTMTAVSKGGSTHGVLNRSCEGNDRDNPNQAVFTCEATLQPSQFGSLPLTYQHEDRLDFKFAATNGGYVKIQNMETGTEETHYYNGATQEHAFQMKFDTVLPYHCKVSSGCSKSMLTVTDITDSPSQTISWDGWMDDAAGLDHYKYVVHELEIRGDELGHGEVKASGMVNVATSSGTTTFSVADPGMYAVVLTAYDKATNFKTTRRLFLYDATSEITTTSSVLRVTSAAEVASWQWQQTEGDVTVTWTERYTNVFHDHNKLLAVVEAHNLTESAYDDNDGTRTVNAIQNTLGIVKFTTAYAIDSAGGTTLTLPADTAFSQEPGLSGVKVMQAGVKDGQTLIFWVRAYDIRDVYMEESVTVHVDSSPPIITNLWLTKDHIENVSVHGLEQLNEMTIEWVAYDDHSGLETVQWRLVDLFSGTEIVHGVENLPAQGQTENLSHCQTTYGTYARGPNCYCTGAAGCYHRHFQVKPVIINSTQSHGGIFSHASTGVHDYDYHLEVTVMNNAKLSTTVRKQITLDASPPHTGVVHDGMPGAPEVDYQSSRTLHAHWSDFFDRESGIKFYQYAFDTNCLPASVFGHATTDTRVNVTYDTMATWEAPSSQGKYHVTVVAFNSAIEPSDPVCSDGVTVDVTPPVVTQVYVEGARVARGLVRDTGNNNLWFIDTDRGKRLVDNPDQACLDKAAINIDLNEFVLKPLTTPIPASEACQFGPFQSKFLSAFYLGKHHHLYLNWTGVDAESGIYDYEVGIATSSSNKDTPDISGYRSTNHHSFYSVYHPTLPVESPFYILIRATNKADVSDVTSVGPVTLVRRPASYTGSVTLSTASDSLLVNWDKNLFIDVEPELLTFSVALEEETGGASLHPHVSPQFSGPCSVTVPPSCAAFSVSRLHWGLHDKHTYVAKVKVTNIVGLDLELTSDPYVQDSRLAARGTVYDVVPAEEVVLLDVQRSEDTDFQLSRAVYEARWSGFEDGTQDVTYRVGVGRQPGSNDVVTFLSVGTAKSHKFINLNLQLNTKYFFTVVAVTSGGEVTVSSDGITVIQAGQPVDGVVVLDGRDCPQTASQNWTSEHHAETVPVPCEADRDYQLSQDTLIGRWTLTTEQRMRYPDVQWKVQKAFPGVDVWLDVTDYTDSPRTDMIIADGLPLQAGSRYRFAVKLCVGVTCSQAIYSDGVTVPSSPPQTGRMAVEYAEEGGEGSSLVVTFETFKDPDVSDLASAQTVLAGYQWTLVDRSQGQRLLQPWQTVPSVLNVNNTHSSFTVSLPSALSFSECLGVSLRGTNKVRLVSELTADIKDCQAIDPALVVPRLVLDAVGSTVEGSPETGGPVTLGFNDGWDLGDRDYTPHTNVISAVWPTMRHSNVTWAVMASQGQDVTSHFLNSGPQASADPCSLPDVIACGHVVGQKYVNVNFGPAHSRPLLENGRHYYVCVHAEAETVPFEKWAEQLPEVSACSDGVTVDTTPPKAGTVEVDGLRGGVFQTSLSVVSVRWSGFSDIEEIRATAHHSGIARYLVSVGSVPAGEDVLKSKDVGLTNHVTLHGLVLQDGHTYYVTVKAEDHAGRKAATISEGFVPDSSAPLRTSAQFRFAQDFITSFDTVSVCWKDMFADEESGLDNYLVSVGSRPGHDDIMLDQTVTTECGEFVTDLAMVNGHGYYVTVKAMNGAGLQTSATSPAITVMTTSPSEGHVYDGHSPVGGSSAKDLDFVTSSTDVAAFWTGFSTPLSPVTSYSVRLGRCPGCGDVMNDFDIGLTEEVNWSHLPLHEGVRYYTTITACNAVGQCTEVTSDGIMIDATPPVKGDVWDGTGDEDIQFQAQRDYLGAQWRGFTDLGSGLAGFSWRAGTTAGGSDVMTSRDVGLSVSAFTTLASQLPVGQTIFITVTATDRAGNSVEETSNGFRVDSSPPSVVQPPVLSRGLGTLDGQTLVSRDGLAVRWQLQDSTSAVATQFLSLSSHQLGEFESKPVQVPGPLREYAFTTLSLHDGSRYSVKVTGCDLARLCTTTILSDVLLDSTPPTTGMFAVDTDHAADLRRHVDGWMGWTTNGLSLAWLGFQDIHSGIDNYQVAVGSTPFAADFMPSGSPTTVSHSETGPAYEDEGKVQNVQVSTAVSLSAGDSIYVAVWAVNGVGLRSHPALSQFDLEVGGGLSLRRRCTTYSCLSQCVCGVQGGTCGAPNPASCVVHTEGSNPNTLLTVSDHADLSALASLSTSSDDYLASMTYMAATWTSAVTQNLRPARYEVTVGRSNLDTPDGVFNSVEDRVWKDVGTSTYAVIVLPPDRALTPNLVNVSYSSFVRCWYTDGSYALFKSHGMNPLTRPATTTNQVGRAVKEHKETGQEKDVDFVTSSDSVYISWKGKFISTSSPVQRFNVYIGTALEANDIHSSPDLAPTSESYQATGLALQEDTLYYSTVLAWGEGALVTWAVSDGFMVDTTRPVAGVVIDGFGLEDANYQSREDHVSATWHGFSDTGSGVRRYKWCVGLSSDSVTCDVMPWTDVGLMTSGSADLTSPVAQGAVLYNKVYAEDAAGHKSEVSVSNGVKVDTTPPLAKDIVYSDGINLLSNPSFEVDTSVSGNQTVCDDAPPTDWQVTPGSCVTLLRPAHTVSADGSQHVLLSGTLTQTVTGLTPGSVYRLTVRLGYPHTPLPHHRPLTGHVTLGRERHPFELDPAMCGGVCDLHLERVIMWHEYTYTTTPSITSLDISITTTVASGEQQLAVDHADFQEVRYVEQNGADPKPGLSTGAVFLPEWSVVQASWHFTDTESPIIEYQWALGTVPGGVQIQPFRSVGRRQHATASGLKLTHQLPIYVTVLARNAAGLTSVALSEALVTDLTPPDISNLVDGTGSDVDFQTSFTVSATWTAGDSESGVAYCQWAVGFTPGRGDVLPFQNVPTPPSDTFTASADVTSTLADITLPQTLYVAVRCYNRAGLPAHDVTDGVTIVPSDSQDNTGTLRMLPDSLTQYPVQETCHMMQDRLRVHWDNVASTIPIAAFQVGYTFNGASTTETTPQLPYLLQSARIQQVNFDGDTLYNVSLAPVDIQDQVGSKVIKAVHVKPDPPSVAAGGSLTSSVSGTNLIVSWPDLFLSDLDLVYEVTVGSVLGGSDLLLWRETEDTSVVISLERARATSFTLRTIVTAVDPCGQFVSHIQSIAVNL